MEEHSNKGKLVKKAIDRLKAMQGNRLDNVENFRQRNVNVQAWIDVRELATVAAYAVGQGYENTLSGVVRMCFDSVFKAVVASEGEDSAFTTTDEAIQVLLEMGFSMGQYRDGGRARRRGAQSMGDEEVFLERVAHGSPNIRDQILTRRNIAAAGGMSMEELKSIVESNRDLVAPLAGTKSPIHAQVPDSEQDRTVAYVPLSPEEKALEDVAKDADALKKLLGVGDNAC